MAAVLASLTSLVNGTSKQDEQVAQPESTESSPDSQVAAAKVQEALAQKSPQVANAKPELPKTTPPPALTATANASQATPAATLSTELPKREEERTQTLGLEDPSDPRTIDDPAIFSSNQATVPLPPPGSEPINTLVDSQGLPYVDPKVYGGSMLDKVGNGFGEPLNVIISSLSSPDLLTKKGCQTYLRSLNFDFECLGLHGGGYQQAYVDPRGWLDQNFIFREIYTPFDHVFGTCIESLIGGNHVRAWQQQGTGAWFFAVSKEQNISTHHSLVANGYDVGRDLLVQVSQKEKNGVTSFIGKKYQTKVEWVSNLLAAGTAGVNHNIPTDGRTAVLTVTRLDGKAKAVYSTQVKEQKAEAKRQKKEEKELKRQSVPAQPQSQTQEQVEAQATSNPVEKKKWYKRISLAA